jgi:hypothetical protein
MAILDCSVMMMMMMMIIQFNLVKFFINSNSSNNINICSTFLYYPCVFVNGRSLARG